MSKGISIPLALAVAIPVALLTTLGGRYYFYVTNTDSPYDEVGIALNGIMPGPIRDWGCGRLKATFGTKALPPSGCDRPDAPGEWR